MNVMKKQSRKHLTLNGDEDQLARLSRNFVSVTILLGTDRFDVLHSQFHSWYHSRSQRISTGVRFFRGLT